jgi:hypothetical protein
VDAPGKYDNKTVECVGTDPRSEYRALNALSLAERTNGGMRLSHIEASRNGSTSTLALVGYGEQSFYLFHYQFHVGFWLIFGLFGTWLQRYRELIIFMDSRFDSKELTGNSVRQLLCLQWCVGGNMSLHLRYGKHANVSCFESDACTDLEVFAPTLNMTNHSLDKNYTTSITCYYSTDDNYASSCGNMSIYAVRGSEDVQLNCWQYFYARQNNQRGPNQIPPPHLLLHPLW